MKKSILVLVIFSVFGIGNLYAADYEKVSDYMLKETQQKQVTRILTVRQLKDKKAKLESQLAEVEALLQTAAGLGVVDQADDK